MTSTLHNPDYRTFVEHLVRLRLREGMTQVELAHLLQKPQSFVSKVERFERRIDPAEFHSIALALGVDPVAEFAEIAKLLER